VSKDPATAAFMLQIGRNAMRGMRDTARGPPARRDLSRGRHSSCLESSPKPTADGSRVSRSGRGRPLNRPGRGPVLEKEVRRR
jgi:hypothetical protein